MYSICMLLFLEAFVRFQLAEAVMHTNEFAVHIPGGKNLVQKIADKYGFVNRGQIGALENYYLFEHHQVQKRSTSQSLEHCDFLRNDPSVLWFEQQEVKQRVKRSIPQAEKINFKDPLYSEQWHLIGGARDGYDMNVIPAWEEGYTGKGIVVSILDDGIQFNHPDLAQNYDKDASFDLNDSDDDPMPKDNDDNKHGTRCAGEVASVANNKFCGVGIAYNASIGGVRMLDGTVTDSVEAGALSLNPNHIHIYSASWGPEDDGKTVDGPGKLAQMAFKDGATKGRNGLGSIFVWASGNGGRHSDNCNCDGYTNQIYTISVSSATQSGLMPWYLEQCSSTLATTYSSGVSPKDHDIITVDVDTSYLSELERDDVVVATNLCTKSHTGTSASAPIAAAMCALALEANPLLTWRDMQYLIVLTSRYKPLARESGWATNAVGRKVSTKFGYGLMDAGAMVKLGKQWKTLPEQHICNSDPNTTEQSIPATHGEKVESIINTTACKNTADVVYYLEHVQIKTSLSYLPRGNLQISLISPSGTCSVILLPRPHDKLEGSFNEFSFMSVHFWGESPQGIWKLVVVNDGNILTNGGGKLTNWSLVFYGTKTQPQVKTLQESNLYSNTQNKVPIHVSMVEVEHIKTRNINKCSDRKQFMLKKNEETICVHKCPEGHYGDLNDNTCHNCDESCSICYGPSYNNCLSCTVYFLLNNICTKSCPDGYFPNSDKHQCYPCSSSCKTCESMEVCYTCKSGLFLDQRCVATCPLGKYVHQQSCRNCHPSCESCYGPLSHNCLSCPASSFLNNSTCVTYCPQDFYATDEYTCNKCHRSCEHCQDSKPCIKCYSTWRQDSTVMCYNSKCSSELSNADLESCECYDNCDQCSGPNNQDCVYCDTSSNNYWHEGQCAVMDICPDGYFLTQDECSPCHNLCARCKTSDECLLCKDGFILHLGKCYQFCPVGYFNGGEKACGQCHLACLHCIGASEFHCTSCPKGFYLEENTCLDTCRDGFFHIGEQTECLPCYNTCKTCSDFGPMQCTSCYNNASFYEGFCIPCLYGEFYDNMNKKCERCHASCGRCFGPEEDNCVSCSLPLRLDEVTQTCLRCCSGLEAEESGCCSCSKDLDICINSDHPRSVEINLAVQNYKEVVIPLSHVVPIVIAICSSAVLLFVVVFGLLQVHSSGLCSFKFGRPKYERVPNMSAKFDAEMEKVSLTQEDIEEEDDVFEKV